MRSAECRVSQAIATGHKIDHIGLIATKRTELPTDAAGPVCQYIIHKLRLQLLRAAFSTHVERTFMNRQLFIPRCQVHDGKFV